MLEFTAPARLSQTTGIPNATRLVLLNSLVCSWCRSLLLSSLISESTQTVDGLLGSHSSSRGKHVCSTSNLPVGVFALPDAGSHSLDALLSAEGAHVLGSLGDFEFLDDLSEGRTVAGAVLADDADLLGSFCLCK